MTTNLRTRATRLTAEPRALPSPGRTAVRSPGSPPAGGPTLGPWLMAQSVNVRRHAAALRPFRPDEFGTGAAAPTPGHLAAVNRLIERLGKELRSRTAAVVAATRAASTDPSPTRLQAVVVRGEQAHQAVRASEQAYDFFWEMFGQRLLKPHGTLLLACDRIALDVYQDVYMGLGRAASIPAPPPMSYLRTGFSPATFRRDVRLQRLGNELNPFPIVQLPYHRLVNPWTLGAILHEVSHNLQNELGMATDARDALSRRLLREGFPQTVVDIWARWHRETFADLLGLLLGGPAIVASLIDILARAPESVATYSERGVHPLPLLRTRISTELLARMGFGVEATSYRRLWDRIYAGITPAAPPDLIRTAPQVIPLVVDTLCYTPYPALGHLALADVVAFEDKHQAMVVEAGRRLARGTDPGIVPERFLIGAARHALDHRLATPGAIAEGFYRDLSRR